MISANNSNILSMSKSPTNRSSRSQASLSHSSSPTHSMNQKDIPLETLVSHLLASKRSLSSISTVWRANQIVTSARSALEESVAIGARTSYLRNGISEQVKILRKVRGGIGSVYQDGQDDFKSVIKSLDEANSRLEVTLDILRSTMVEAAFRPAEEKARSLLDFVDEQGVETMRNALKESIRESKEAQTQFDASILSFDDDLRALKKLMNPSPETTESQSRTLESPIPSHLETLDSHAQEMASLLDSLVQHFDLCVSAVRHTEGGYAAVQKAASSQPPDAEPVSVSGVMTAENDDPSADEPISDEERREMLDVLEKDAAQVDDVVMELRDFLAEMEVKHEAILEYVSSLTDSYNGSLAAYQLLESVSARLPGYIAASQEFRLKWDDTKLNIQEQLAELESMRLFYENYYSSYDGLILEVWRRKVCEEKVKNIMRKAMEQIEKVLEADRMERELFKGDVGDYLPVDLWPGVNVGAPKWEFVRKGASAGDVGEQEPGRESLPELDRDLVEGAGRRERERQRTER